MLLVARGLFDSRAKAQAAIAAGLVQANGTLVGKASENIPVDAVITAEPAHPYVSRGGVKLAAALDHFQILPAGRLCLDVGSSTGGFTQVLLLNGAAHVISVDTGRGQMHQSLLADGRISLFESTDIRALAPENLPGIPDLAVIDVSFIPLSLVLPFVVALLAPKADMVVLVKPQFEVGKKYIGKGGIVRDVAAREDAVLRILDLVAGLGFSVAPPLTSPVTGGDGNVEYLLAAKRNANS